MQSYRIPVRHMTLAPAVGILSAGALNDVGQQMKELEMRKLSETQIKDILRNREQKIANIHKKMFSLYRELENTEEIMETAAFPSTEISGMPGRKGGHKDLGDVLLKYNRQIYNRSEEIRKIMWELAEEEESISRLWACFHALGEPYYSILYALYVENQLYQAVEDEFGSAHKTFEKYRKQGIQTLLLIYGSGDSIAELMRRQKPELRGKKKKKKGGAHREYEQINLSALLPEVDRKDKEMEGNSKRSE